MRSSISHLFLNETNISFGLAIEAFGRLSAVSAIMSPDSDQLPLEIALVFKNGGPDSVAFRVDTSSPVLLRGDGKKYPIWGSSVRLPDSSTHMEGSRHQGKIREISSSVPFWIPAGKNSVLTLDFVPLRTDTLLVLHCRLQGPVTGMSTVPEAFVWQALRPIEVPVSQLPPFSTWFDILQSS